MRELVFCILIRLGCFLEFFNSERVIISWNAENVKYESWVTFEKTKKLKKVCKTGLTGLELLTAKGGYKKKARPL